MFSAQASSFGFYAQAPREEPFPGDNGRGRWAGLRVLAVVVFTTCQGSFMASPPAAVIPVMTCRHPKNCDLLLLFLGLAPLAASPHRRARAASGRGDVPGASLPIAVPLPGSLAHPCSQSWRRWPEASGPLLRPPGCTSTYSGLCCSCRPHNALARASHLVGSGLTLRPAIRRGHRGTAAYMQGGGNPGPVSWYACLCQTRAAFSIVSGLCHQRHRDEGGTAVTASAEASSKGGHS